MPVWVRRRDDEAMQPVWILVHSPSVGPRTWEPVAECLRGRGQECVVPSLLDLALASAPFWPRVVADVNAAASELDTRREVVLVAHSNAGLFMPLLITDAARPVRACLFVDAALPVDSGATPVVPSELLEFLRTHASADGTLPPWSQWWDEEEVAPMFPDPQTRLAVTGEEPRLPLAYYEQMVPAPLGWDAVPCGYLYFGPPYDELAEQASGRGWPVRHEPGLHLHQIVEPDRVADTLIDMARQLTDPTTR